MTNRSYSWNPELSHNCVKYILLHKELIKVSSKQRQYQAHVLQPLHAENNLPCTTNSSKA